MLRTSVVRGFLYTLYLFVVSVGILKIVLRTGLVRTAPYEEREAIKRRLTGRPGVLILGDSFSIEGEASVGSRLRDYFADRGMDTVNLAKMGEGPAFYADRLRQYGDAFEEIRRNLESSPRLLEGREARRPDVRHVRDRTASRP